MHLADGILPLGWAGLGWLAALPFVAGGLGALRRRVATDPRAMPLVALVAVVVFLVSCMPIPIPLVGTSSHPCGTGFAAILVGPWLAVLASVVALLLQALLLAHGGLTTLGANVLSMGVAGAFAGWATFRLGRAAGLPLAPAAFAAGLLSDWATYATTSLELAAALHGQRPFAEAFAAAALAFAPTQLPLGLLEGLVTAGAVAFVARRRPDLWARLGAAASSEAP
jgi:cobalt/nickel transport system permease protein